MVFSFIGQYENKVHLILPFGAEWVHMLIYERLQLMVYHYLVVNFNDNDKCLMFIVRLTFASSIFSLYWTSTETRPWRWRCFLYTLELPQRSNIPVLGTSRYQARYSSRTLRLASSRSRLKIGLTTLAAPAAARVAAVDAMTAVVITFPVVLIRWCHVTVVPPSGASVSKSLTVFMHLFIYLLTLFMSMVKTGGGQLPTVR